MNKQPTPKYQIEGSNKKKFDRELPGRIIRPGGADNPAPSKKFLSVAAAYNSIDRGGRAIQHDSCMSRTTTRGPKHQEYARAKSHPRDRTIPASIVKTAW
jgi:hypothetical protein